MKKRKSKKELGTFQTTDDGITIPEIFHENMVNALGMDKWPGDPTCRTLVAHEVDDKEIEKIFKENPSTRWIIVIGKRVIDRKESWRSLVPQADPIRV